ncbi:hypothetical protein C8T65DRAFT_737267 [Cerioporus squamosus]|nr:hypothetical protein C8T65DRAFT_737267 [Cerioporus squamosus]
MSHVDDATTVVSSSSCLQFRDITVVSCGAGPQDEPVIYHGASAFVIENIATRWLLIEFPSGDSARSPFPFPTANLDQDIQGLIFELPSTFNFEYFAEHRAARWVSKEPCKRFFSLVFTCNANYRKLWAAMSASQGYGARTTAAFMTLGSTPALARLAQQRLGGADLARGAEQHKS